MKFPSPISRAAAVLALALVQVVSPAWAQETDAPPSDERIREAWSYLLPEEQREVTEWFRAEVSYLDTYQNKMIAYMLDGEERDRGAWPHRGLMEVFDPQEHAPAQPIPRKWLDADSSKAKAAMKQLKGSMPVDPLRRAWEYDWATGELVIVGDERDPELLFENALQGLPPLIDLAEALLLRRLDDGSQRIALAAYLHAYTDRSGNVYPGISLYDAWSSGREFEMPDVDTLGILHDVYADWRSFKAPVPTSKQKKLYAKIGVAFIEAKHHRELREAVAANFLRGQAVPVNPYKPNAVAFNALWQEYQGVPEAFAEDLPDAKKWKKYLEGLVKKVKQKKFRDAGQGRIDWLESERWRVKSTLIWVMTEFGAMDRKKLPKPKPKPLPKPEKKPEGETEGNSGEQSR